MPRPLRKDRCETCRSRKVKCDGHHPVCLPCQRSSRSCQWGQDGPPSQSFRSPVIADIAQSRPIPSSSSEGNEYVSTKDPEAALQNPLVARIFRYYIDNLASWYDLNDSKRHFEDIVPACARRNSLLLSAILAFSAASLSSSTRKSQLWEIAESYHLESVQRLLSLTENIDAFRTGETLVAICLLRSYEIISQNVSAQNHLRGSYSLLATYPHELGRGLVRAGFWNYLREDITVALMERRGLMIELNDRHPPLTFDGEDDFANHITYILGKTINRCLQQDGVPLNRNEWECLKEEVERWSASLPSSFEPISTRGMYGESSFPCLWNTSKWHTSSLHYYHTVMTILWLAEPVEREINTLQNIERMKSIEARLEYHAIQNCALAISSNSAPVWVNAFGPISFCGPWIRKPPMLAKLTQELSNWGSKTGWPVSNIAKSLLESPAG